MKVVVNECYGGFGLSRKALHKLRDLGNKHALEETDIGEKWGDSNEVRKSSGLDSFLSDIPRDDPQLVSVVETMGAEANARFAELSVTEIPDDVEWQIGEYDGTEWVEEKHRTW